SSRRRTPQAWQRQPARESTVVRIDAHSEALAARRPRARGPPARIRRAAACPTQERRVSTTVPHQFAHVGQVRSRRLERPRVAYYLLAVVADAPGAPIPASTHDNPQGRSRPHWLSPPPWRRGRRTAQRAPSLRCPAWRSTRCDESARPGDWAPGLEARPQGPLRLSLATSQRTREPPTRATSANLESVRLPVRPRLPLRAPPPQSPSGGAHVRIRPSWSAPDRSPV